MNERIASLRYGLAYSIVGGLWACLFLLARLFVFPILLSMYPLAVYVIIFYLFMAIFIIPGIMFFLYGMWLVSLYIPSNMKRYEKRQEELMELEYKEIMKHGELY